jgi:methionyl-tRNA formyltransferase
MKEKTSFSIIILNQQKNKIWLKKLISIIKKENSKNKIKVLKKITKKDLIKTKCNFLISFHNGQIVKDDIINYLNGNCINFHNSALPKNRGWAPILWTAYNNDIFASTIHKISTGLDTGDICGQKIIKKSLKNFSMEDVYGLLESGGLNLFKKIFPKMKKEIITKKKYIKYKKQLIKKGSYQNEILTNALMERLPKNYKTKISEINLLGLHDKRIKQSYT